MWKQSRKTSLPSPISNPSRTQKPIGNLSELPDFAYRYYVTLGLTKKSVLVNGRKRVGVSVLSLLCGLPQYTATYITWDSYEFQTWTFLKNFQIKNRCDSYLCFVTKRSKEQTVFWAPKVSVGKERKDERERKDRSLGSTMDV